VGHFPLWHGAKYAMWSVATGVENYTFAGLVSHALQMIPRRSVRCRCGSRTVSRAFVFMIFSVGVPRLGARRAIFCEGEERFPGSPFSSLASIIGLFSGSRSYFALGILGE
jgi:hypothetical protein